MSDPSPLPFVAFSSFVNLSRKFGRTAGTLIILASTMGLLWWNETSAIAADALFGDLTSEIASANADQIDLVNEGRLIHVSGQAQAGLALQDLDLDLLFEDVLAVSRNVEMYQWIEIRRDGAISYELGWSAKWRDSSTFRQADGHLNPPMQLNSETWQATDASLSAFTLSTQALAQLKPTRSFTPNEAPIGWKRIGNQLYSSLDAAKPILGDVRVRYKVLPSQTELTVLGKQNETGIEPYHLQNGTDVLIVRPGTLRLDEMLANQDLTAIFRTWAQRLACALALCYAMSRLFSHHRKVPAEYVTVEALTYALPLFFGTIACAWLLHRPLESGVLLLLGLASFAFLFRYKDGQSQSTSAQHEPKGALAL